MTCSHKPRGNAKRTGDISEAGAVLWLLNQGFEVFRNVSCVGPADLVAWRPGEAPLLIDVKTLNRGWKTYPKVGRHQPGVRILVYDKGAHTATWGE